MKKGFKRTFVLGAAFTVATGLSACGKLYGPPPDAQQPYLTSTEAAADKRIDTVGLEFFLGERVVPDHFMDYEAIDTDKTYRRFLGTGYKPAYDNTGELKSPYVTYVVTPYTYYSDNEWMVTRIEIKDPKVTVYGHNIETDSEEFDKTLQEKGFSVSVVGETHVARRDGISLLYGKGEIRIYR